MGVYVVLRYSGLVARPDGSTFPTDREESVEELNALHEHVGELTKRAEVAEDALDEAEAKIVELEEERADSAFERAAGRRVVAYAEEHDDCLLCNVDAKRRHEAHCELGALFGYQPQPR